MITPYIMMHNTSTYGKVCTIAAMFFVDFMFRKIETIFKHLVGVHLHKKEPATISFSWEVICGRYESKNSFMPRELFGLMVFITNQVRKGEIDVSNIKAIQPLDNTSNKKYNFMVFTSKDPLVPIHVTKDIECFFRYETSCHKETQTTTKLLTVDLKSTKNDMNALINFVDAMHDLYDSMVGITKKPTDSMCVLTGFSSDYPIYKVMKTTNTKRFDSMFFDSKSHIISILDEFMHNKDRYMRLGIPYTLGFLFHGNPGTGKTSAIKAISNYMDRQISIIRPSLIKNRFQLEKLFLEKVDGTYETQHRIFVFEEIECGGWKDVVLDRRFKKGEDKDMSVAVAQQTMMMQMMCMSEDNKTVAKENTDDRLMLSDILEVLDGIIETPGRVIIFTTNHHEQLDQALMRPGRVDHVIEFKNMTRQGIRDMHALWFDRDIPEEVYASMKDYVFSQADIGKLFKTASEENRWEALRSNSSLYIA